MKTILKCSVSLLLITCLLCGALTVMAARYDFSGGSVPDGWTHLGSDDKDLVTATAVLDPVNPYASTEARNLYAYLSTLSDTQTMLSGQFDIKTDDSTYQATKEQFDLEPALYSTRYTVDTSTPVWVLDKNGKETLELAEENTAMDFLNVDEANALLKQHYDNGNVLLVHSDGAIRSVCFEVARKNNPDLYTDYANCIRELDATNPDRDLQVYALWRLFQENEIASLRKLEALGVNAYLWRTWVEFNYQPFFGTDEGGYAHFVRVYQQTVDAMIESGLTGFLVCYSPGAKSNTLQRYPGNEYVDTLAVTLYSEHELGGRVSPADLVNYEWYVRTGKPLGLSEWSCRTGIWQETADRTRASSFELLQSTVTYFPAVTWVDFWDGTGYWPLDLEGTAAGNDDGMLYLESPFTLTLDEIVDYRQTALTSPGVVQLFTADGNYVGLEEKAYSASDLTKRGIDLAAVSRLRINTDYAITFYTGKNMTGEAYAYGTSTASLPAEQVKTYRSCRVTRLQNVALNQNEIYASVNDDGAWKANDGLSTLWEGDVFAGGDAAEPGTAWLMIDLGDTYRVGHYVLRLAGYAGRQPQYNVAEYYLQYSNDGENWTSTDHVVGNTLSQLDRYFNHVVARYFRVLVVTPNSAVSDTDKGFVGIAELELYGLPEALPQEEQPEIPEEDPDNESGDDTKPEDTESNEDTDSESIGEDEDTAPEEEPDSGTSSPEEEPAPDGSGDEPVTDGDDGVADEETEDPQESLPDEETTEPDTEDEDSSGNKKKPVQIVTTETYFPWWAWLLVGLGVLAAAGVVVVVLLRKKKANITE